MFAPTVLTSDIKRTVFASSRLNLLGGTPCESAHPGGEGGAAESILRIEKLLGISIEFHELDLLDKPGLDELFKKVRGTGAVKTLTESR